MKMLSKDWEWVAALPRPVPCWLRRTMGFLRFRRRSSGALAQAAVEFAMSSPEPDPAHVLNDVFYEG